VVLSVRFEFDIKYNYIQGKRINAQVLTVIDVFSRWNMRQDDVVILFDKIFETYKLLDTFMLEMTMVATGGEPLYR